MVREKGFSKNRKSLRESRSAFRHSTRRPAGRTPSVSRVLRYARDGEGGNSLIGSPDYGRLELASWKRACSSGVAPIHCADVRPDFASVFTCDFLRRLQTSSSPATRRL